MKKNAVERDRKKKGVEGKEKKRNADVEHIHTVVLVVQAIVVLEDIVALVDTVVDMELEENFNNNQQTKWRAYI